YNLVKLAENEDLPLTEAQRHFVAMDLSHLQSPHDLQLAGILGSAFMDRYVVGIDYRRQKLYLWNPQPNNQTDTK
ncbi:MAG: hypothetical protein AAF597_12885, partial [Bacteroidota bacterium]